MARVPVLDTSTLASKVGIQNSTYSFGVDGGANDDYTITLTPAPAEYVVGQVFYVKVNTPNTGSARLSIGVLSPVTIKKLTDQDLATGDLEAGTIMEVAYDGTYFQLLSTTAAGVSGFLPTAGGTMTGDITLGENAAIALDPAGSADGKYTGTTITGTAGATIAFGDIIVLDVTASKWLLADANSAAAADGDARGLIGVCVLASTDTNPTKILLNGVVRADSKFPALTISAPVYLSETAGAIVVSQPVTTDVVVRVLGFALTADEIYFSPSSDYITHT